MSDKTSDKTSDKLLMCPFCGGEAEFYSYEAERDIYDSDTLGYVDTEYFTKYGVSCTGCNCLMAEYYSEEEVIKAWNTRKPMEMIVERLEEKVEITWKHDYMGGRKDAFVEAIEIVKEESN